MAWQKLAGCSGRVRCRRHLTALLRCVWCSRRWRRITVTPLGPNQLGVKWLRWWQTVKLGGLSAQRLVSFVEQGWVNYDLGAICSSWGILILAVKTALLHQFFKCLKSYFNKDLKTVGLPSYISCFKCFCSLKTDKACFLHFTLHILLSYAIT